MNRTPDQLREQEAQRRKEADWFSNNPPTWRYQPTKEELQQREKDIREGVIPF